MKYILTKLFLVAFVVGVTQLGYGQMTWKVKTDKAKITFSELGSGAEGTFSGLDAAIRFDPTNLNKSSIKARIKVSTVTASEGEDQAKDILSKDYLHGAKYPYITYESNKIKKIDKGFELIGKLTIKETTKVIKIPFVFTKQDKTAVFKGKINITSKDFGLAAGEVVIDLEVPVKQK
ncbi:YceI family protein [uncultured Microscilla sp.]|uniref:YceI family protein n=1 Tax=uncultured Microscilla sp. TaxID=432653 RepID=UPI002612E9A7|nr:YceI family protein [uncultured Microscilla sp.]